MWSDKMLLSVRCHKPQQKTDFETNTKNPTDFFLLSLRDETGDFTVVLLKGGNQIRLQLPETERREIPKRNNRRIVCSVSSKGTGAFIFLFMPS